MSNLISGKEALIALLSGKEAQMLYDEENWDAIENWEFWKITNFTNMNYKFRLKPRTITINNIEVPAPLSETEQRKGAVFYLNDGFPDGYALMELDPLDTPFCIGAWRTEEEIKQVVAALRKVFGGTA